ncbi:MAG: hypothetical protein V7K89_09285 [Nostoc sp.]|uniref:hypothetical protein n=1 Tax=Nostoc sp. TaxID=1180 RepID=UPI002FFBDF1E
MSSSVSFRFTDSIDDYESDYPGRAIHAVNFQMLNPTQRAVALKWIGKGGEYYNVSNLNPFELNGASDRRFYLSFVRVGKPNRSNPSGALISALTKER